MTIIENILLGVATLIYFGLLSLVYGSHNRSGDAGVGFAFTMILANAGFIICMAIVTTIIYNKGGFSWVNPIGSVSRGWLVFGGFLLTMAGNFFFSFGESDPIVPQAIRPVFKYVLPGLLPLLILVSAAILLNDNWRVSLPAITYKLPIKIAVSSGVIMIAILVAAKFHQIGGKLTAAPDEKDPIFYNSLANIDSINVMKEMVFLLVYTNNNKHPELRERALAKIKSRPNWQEELVRRIKTKWAPEVFTFLASNEVDDKAMFAEPIRQGILMQASLFREKIKGANHPSNLYEGQFLWEVEQVLKTLEKFEGLGTDYHPAIQEMRKALDESSRYDSTPKFDAAKVLDKWLKRH